MAKKLKQDNADGVGIKCVQNDERKLTLSVDDNKPPVKGLAIRISTDIVSKVVNKIKVGNATGCSDVMGIKAANNETINQTLQAHSVPGQSTKWLTFTIYHQSFQRNKRCCILWELHKT